MNHRAQAASHALAFLALLATAGPASAQTPFPVDKNQRLEELGDSFVVEGRIQVPRRLTLEAMRAMTITGKGEDATIELSGKLRMRAATGGKIVFQDVWLEIAPDCKELTLANCEFKGRGGIRPSPQGPCDLDIVLEALEADRSTSVTIEAAGGTVLMDRCFLDGPLVLRGVTKSGKGRSGLQVTIYGSTGRDETQRPRGLLGGLTVEGVKDGTIRTCDIAGGEALFADNRKLAIDGNNMRADRIEFRSTDGNFGGIDVTKCDFRPKELFVNVPEGGKSARLTFETCWFRGLEDPATIRNEMLRDSENSDSAGVAVLRDVRATPMGLAGEEK